MGAMTVSCGPPPRRMMTQARLDAAAGGISRASRRQPRAATHTAISAPRAAGCRAVTSCPGPDRTLGRLMSPDKLGRRRSSDMVPFSFCAITLVLFSQADGQNESAGRCLARRSYVPGQAAVASPLVVYTEPENTRFIGAPRHGHATAGNGAKASKGHRIVVAVAKVIE
jgi:hypothetical protein